MLNELRKSGKFLDKGPEILSEFLCFNEIMENFIRPLTALDRSEYEKLLRMSFASAEGFTAEAGTLVWTPTDDYYTVLGLWENQQLKAMMRIEWIDSEKELLIKLSENDLPKAFQYPLGYFAKAATLPSEKGRGLNTVLRYHCLKIMLNWQVTEVLGFMVEGSPRIQTMKEMGYQFFEKKSKWNGNFKSDRKVLMASLAGEEKIRSAITFIEKKFPLVLRRFPLGFSLNSVTMIAKIRYRFPWD